MITVTELIEQLKTIEDKNQFVIGDVWIAEDFTYEDHGQEVKFTPEELAEVGEWRSIAKSLGYFYLEIQESLTRNREEK